MTNADFVVLIEETERQVKIRHLLELARGYRASARNFNRLALNCEDRARQLIEGAGK